MAPKSGSSEICDWQLQCSELKQRGAYLLQSGEWSDCSFVVDSERQVLVRAHKLILAMASPVFEAMFYGSMPEGNKPIPISDVQPEAFKALLEYIYTDNINLNSIDAACNLCYGAKKYMLNHLVKECIKYLWPNINAKNACQIYEFARLLQENILMEKCLQVISINTKEVLKDTSFNDIDYDTMRTIFSLEHLNVDSELDLFEAATRHVKAQINEPKEEKVVNEDSSADSSPAAGAATPEAGPEAGSADPAPAPGSDAQPENRQRQTIRGAIEVIRFLTLSAQQFAGGPAQSPLLTKLEAFAVLMHILSSRPNDPLPAGFNASREPRKQLIGNRANKKDISPSPPFIDFINQEFERINMTVPSTWWCNCSCAPDNMMSSNLFSTHRFANCPIFANERLDFELVCRVFKVDPYSVDIKNHENTKEALDIFLNKIKQRRS